MQSNLPSQSQRQLSVAIYTLGCKVNQYESEAIAEYLCRQGYDAHPAQAGEVADAYIINTCTVTAESDRKARQFVRRALSHNPDAYVVVTGCLAQTNAKSLADIDGVDAVIGNRNKLAAATALCALIKSGVKNSVPYVDVASLEGAAFEPMSIRAFPRTRAYIKIEDGCESRCTYCIIPDARGHIRSKQPSEVLREVCALTESGCPEVVLTGIETASWGKDLEPKGNLADLLAAVDAIPHVGRVRLGSLDPSLIKEPFVRRIAALSSLAPHFHLSLQSGSNSVLARMKRKYNREQALAGIKLLRAAFPDLMLTTDVIVGFPGETDQEFQDTLDFVRSARFLMVHIFPFSPRKGTPAASMPDQVPPAVKKARLNELEACAGNIRRALLQEMVQRALPLSVLFETWEDGVAVGHTANFVEVRISSPQPLHAQTLTVLPLSLTDDGGGLRAVLLDPAELTERNRES